MSMPFTPLKLFSRVDFRLATEKRGLSDGTIVTSYITLSQLVHEGVHVCVRTADDRCVSPASLPFYPSV